MMVEIVHSKHYVVTVLPLKISKLYGHMRRPWGRRCALYIQIVVMRIRKKRMTLSSETFVRRRFAGGLVGLQHICFLKLSWQSQ